MPYSLGIVVVLLSWLSGAYLLRKLHGHNLNTISKHGASSKRAHLFFIAVLVVFGTLFYLWLMQYLTPIVNFKIPFIIILTTAVLLQFVAAIVPDIAGWQRNIHQYAAWTMAVLWIPLVLLISFSDTLSVSSRTIGLLGSGYMIGTFILFIISAKARKHFLAYQVSYVIMFQIVLIATVYLN